MGIVETHRITINCDHRQCPRYIHSTTYTRREVIDRARKRDWFISLRHNLAFCPDHRDNIRKKSKNEGAYKKAIPETTG
jgi:hypothetical protein